MTLHRRNRLPFLLALSACLLTICLWQMLMPQLDLETDKLHRQETELQKRRQAAAAQTYQPLIDRLQRPLPLPATIIAAIHKVSGALGLADAVYSLSPVRTAEQAGLHLASRRLSLSLPKTDAAQALAFWQDLRAALPCELRLSMFSADNRTAGLEVELLGSPP